MKYITILILFAFNCLASESNLESSFLKAIDAARKHNSLLYDALYPTRRERTIADIRIELENVKDKLVVYKEQVNHLSKVYRSQKGAVHKNLSLQAIQKYSDFRYHMLSSMVYCSSNDKVMKLLQKNEHSFIDPRPQDCSIIHDDTKKRVRMYKDELIQEAEILQDIFAGIKRRNPAESELLYIKLSFLRISFLQRLIEFYVSDDINFKEDADIEHSNRYNQALKILPAIMKNPQYEHIVRIMMRHNRGGASFFL